MVKSRAGSKDEDEEDEDRLDVVGLDSSLGKLSETRDTEQDRSDSHPANYCRGERWTDG